MPKIKSNRSARKRFKISGSGKVLRGSAAVSHYNSKKSGRRKRQLAIPTVVTGKDRKRVTRLLGKLK